MPPLTAKNLPQIGKREKKSGKIGKKEEKSGRTGQNQEGSFTLPLLTDRAGYATGLLALPLFTSSLTWDTQSETIQVASLFFF